YTSHTPLYHHKYIFLGHNYSWRGAAGGGRPAPPRHVVIKKGEHGAVLLTEDGFFLTPGFPLEDVVDPTGAGDAFAGGLLGYLARCGSITGPALRRAVVYGCALGSFACEAFGARRMATLTMAEVEDRVRSFGTLTRFDVPASVKET
ncbi:MAG: hypothetical protein F4X22_11015, partial [Gemmatimonadales bacterium]|nr:hypothetical protein [Candidatus Palauibacter denitrificans]